MTRGGPLVVLDACVLVSFPLADTLLRLAETPSLFEPKWSDEIIRETIRTLETKLEWPNTLTRHLQRELRAHFREAWVADFEHLIGQMKNDDKDRHVLAAAVRCGAPLICDV
jgi:predicted nucleic acid-binding protein